MSNKPCTDRWLDMARRTTGLASAAAVTLIGALALPASAAKQRFAPVPNLSSAPLFDATGSVRVLSRDLSAEGDAGANHPLPAYRVTVPMPPVTWAVRDDSVLVSICRSVSLLCESPGDAATLGNTFAVSSLQDVNRLDTSTAGTAHQARLDAQPFELANPGSGIATGEVSLNLRHALARGHMPDDVRRQVERILKPRIDLDRGAWLGDRYRVLYDRANPGDPLSTAMRVTALEVRWRGKDHSAVWFVADGRPQGDYYTFEGTPLGAPMFAMPVNGARISSHFGPRVHPISGVRHVHSGMDLAAPTGTPVSAAAAGVVGHIGTESGGYGKYVVVRHAGGYSTYYAHLSAYEAALRVGARVERGQRLGAVGSTGSATGPHLHFEVRTNNRPTNPLAFLRESGVPALASTDRDAFVKVAAAARSRLEGAHASRYASVTTRASVGA
ncbi:M23 family metallopeptidase [Burkholderia pyrrocinia]|uniref:M23 family metallopeptidase n=1 Tax=Burkholderia pyrrocinia TaxID=60550 RepID=UPI00140509CE|nr:M23 family metallopeptidase [Burkholderia pyrrocinia]